MIDVNIYWSQLVLLLMRLDYGDVPTWIGSIGALGGLIFLLLNFKTQSKQLALQEKQINEQKETLNDDRRKQWANQFAFWAISSLKNPQIHFVNDAVLPVYQVSVQLCETGSEKLVDAYGSDGVSYGFSTIPRGESFMTLPENTFDVTGTIRVHFTDSAGVRWARESNGQVSLSQHDPKKIKRWQDVPQTH